MRTNHQLQHQQLLRTEHGTPLARCNDCPALGGVRTCFNVADVGRAIGAGVAENAPLCIPYLS